MDRAIRFLLSPEKRRFLAKEALPQQNPMLAQKPKQGQQGQPQYRRLIALNPVKQVRAMAFQPIGANRRKQRLALSGQIGFQKGVGKVAHGQARLRDVLPDALPAAMADQRCHQFMLAPTQALQMGARCCHIGWFVEPGAIANQQLIRANHQRIRHSCCNTFSLGIGQYKRGLIRGNSLGLRGLLDGGFIYASDTRLEAQPSAFQHGAPC